MQERVTGYYPSTDICQDAKDISIVYPEIGIRSEDIVDRHIMSHSTMYREGIGYITTYTWKITYYREKDIVDNDYISF